MPVVQPLTTLSDSEKARLEVDIASSVRVNVNTLTSRIRYRDGSKGGLWGLETSLPICVLF